MVLSVRCLGSPPIFATAAIVEPPPYMVTLLASDRKPQHRSRPKPDQDQYILTHWLISATWYWYRFHLQTRILFDIQHRVVTALFRKAKLVALASFEIVVPHTEMRLARRTVKPACE
jgi:hypothetical protein